MESDEIHRLHGLLHGLHESVHRNAVLNLSLVKALSGRMEILENTLAALHPEASPELLAGQRELAEAWKAHIAKMEFHQDMMSAQLASTRSFIEGGDGAGGAVSSTGL